MSSVIGDPPQVNGVYDYGQHGYTSGWRKPTTKTIVTKTIERDKDGNVTKETTVTETVTEGDWQYPAPYRPYITWNGSDTTVMPCTTASYKG